MHNRSMPTPQVTFDIPTRGIDLQFPSSKPNILHSAFRPFPHITLVTGIQF
jgi:hypothetical protein